MQKAGLYFLCNQENRQRQHDTLRRELHNRARGVLFLFAVPVKPGRATQGKYPRPYLPYRKQERSSAVNRYRIAITCAGLFRMQSRRRRWRGLQPYNAARPSMARRNHAVTGTCSPVHAVPGGLCKFAQNRAVKALQIRPISTTRDALQELTAAISNGLAAFLSMPGSAARRNPDRRQRLTPTDYVRLA